MALCGCVVFLLWLRYNCFVVVLCLFVVGFVVVCGGVVFFRGYVVGLFVVALCLLCGCVVLWRCCVFCGCVVVIFENAL